MNTTEKIGTKFGRFQKEGLQIDRPISRSSPERRKSWLTFLNFEQLRKSVTLPHYWHYLITLIRNLLSSFSTVNKTGKTLFVSLIFLISAQSATQFLFFIFLVSRINRRTLTHQLALLIEFQCSIHTQENFYQPPRAKPAKIKFFSFYVCWARACQCVSVQKYTSLARRRRLISHKAKRRKKNTFKEGWKTRFVEADDFPEFFFSFVFRKKSWSCALLSFRFPPWAVGGNAHVSLRSRRNGVFLWNNMSYRSVLFCAIT